MTMKECNNFLFLGHRTQDSYSTYMASIVSKNYRFILNPAKSKIIGNPYYVARLDWDSHVIHFNPIVRNLRVLIDQNTTSYEESHEETLISK